MTFWGAVIIGCASFLGAFAANVLNQPRTPAPRHPKQPDPQRFPLDLDNADQAHGTHAQHVRPGEGDL